MAPSSNASHNKWQHYRTGKSDGLTRVLLDENLSWKPHISHVASNIPKSIGIIYKSSFFLSKTCLRTLYYSMIYPYLHYCNIVWASTYKTNLRRLVTLQKRAVRMINKSNFDAPSDPIFKDFRMLKVLNIRFVELGKFMYSHKHSLIPKKFNELFSLNSSVHSYNTRNAHAYNLPFSRTNAKLFSVTYQGPKYFNSLDDDIINSISLPSFKSKLKNYIFKNY